MNGVINRLKFKGISLLKSADVATEQFFRYMDVSAQNHAIATCAQLFAWNGIIQDVCFEYKTEYTEIFDSIFTQEQKQLFKNLEENYSQIVSFRKGNSDLIRK